jgi:hypothetical protein
MRYGLRSLLRAPAFAAPAVTTLALASAAVVGVFTLVNAVLLRPLPYRDPSRIVLVWDTPPDGSRTWLSLPEIDDLSRDARSFSGIAGLTDIRMNLTNAGAPEELQVIAASASLFPLLGVDAALGRTFDVDDDRPGRLGGGALVDARLAGFAVLLLLVVTAICAIVPAAGAARASDVAAVDRAVGRSSRFAMVGRTLAVAQIALAALALVCTALLARTVSASRKSQAGSTLEAY